MLPANVRTVTLSSQGLTRLAVLVDGAYVGTVTVPDRPGVVTACRPVAGVGEAATLHKSVSEAIEFLAGVRQPSPKAGMA
jgi:hypothetical protein